MDDAASGSSLPPWLADPSLERLWSTVRSRLERNGLQARGRVMIGDLTRDERHAIGGLLGRVVATSRITVDVGQLDSSLRLRSGIGGVAEVISLATGDPLRDRRVDRATTIAAREQPYDAARDRARSHAALSEAPWTELWFEQVRRSGVLSRVAPEDAASLLIRAVDLVADLVSASRNVSSVSTSIAGPPGPAVTISRTELAARVAGSAHGLDDGSALAAVVLRGLAMAGRVDAPTTTEQRRLLWQQFGVLPDTVSTTCLLLGIRAEGTGSAPTRLAAAADAGDPIHLTAWDMRSIDSMTAAGPVLVCENPGVLEAVARRFGSAVPVVCGMGRPALVVHDVLARVTRSGTDLHYHGDFDWPGVAIANRVIEMYGARPWRMDSERYLAALSGPTIALSGASVEPRWDAELGAAMRSAGMAVHEEAVLTDLLSALPLH